MIVSVTRLRLRSWRLLPAFMAATLRAMRQTRRASGFCDGAVLIDRRLTFWTLTRWTDAAAMRAWRGDGAHGRAMGRLAGWCDEASVVRWEADPTGTLPGWQECHQRMLAQGRPTAVRAPSANQLAFVIAAPRVGRLGMLINGR